MAVPNCSDKKILTLGEFKRYYSYIEAGPQSQSNFSSLCSNYKLKPGVFIDKRLDQIDISKTVDKQILSNPKYFTKLTDKYGVTSYIPKKNKIYMYLC